MGRKPKSEKAAPSLAPGPLAPRTARLFVEGLARRGGPAEVARGMEEMGARCVLPRRASGVRGPLQRLELFYTRVLGCEALPPQAEDGRVLIQVYYCPLGRLVFAPRRTPCAPCCEAMARGVLGRASRRLAVHAEQGPGGRCNIFLEERAPLFRPKPRPAGRPRGEPGPR